MKKIFSFLVIVLFAAPLVMWVYMIVFQIPWSVPDSPDPETRRSEILNERIMQLY